MPKMLKHIISLLLSIIKSPQTNVKTFTVWAMGPVKVEITRYARIEMKVLTVSAATRFNPTPPALVEIKKTKGLLSSASEFKLFLTDCWLKLLIAAKRSSALIEPSRRSYVYFLNSKKS